MQIIATVISTRGLGYVVDLLTDGELYIGAFYVHGGMCDFIPGTGSRDIAATLNYIEQALGVAKAGPAVPNKRSDEELAELRYECMRDAAGEECA